MFVTVLVGLTMLVLTGCETSMEIGNRAAEEVILAVLAEAPDRFPVREAVPVLPRYVRTYTEHRVPLPARGREDYSSEDPGTLRAAIRNSGNAVECDLAGTGACSIEGNAGERGFLAFSPVEFSGEDAARVGVHVVSSRRDLFTTTVVVELGRIRGRWTVSEVRAYWGES